MSWLDAHWATVLLGWGAVGFVAGLAGSKTTGKLQSALLFVAHVSPANLTAAFSALGGKPS